VAARVLERPLPGQDGSHDGHVLASSLERVGEGLPVPPLHHLRPGDAQTEQEAAAGQVRAAICMMAVPSRMR
jgi:hypothetical protein